MARIDCRIRHFARVFVLLSAVMCISMAGCGKRYSSLEEYVQSNPMPDTFTNMSLSAENINFTVDPMVSENTVIIKIVFDKAIFGEDENGKVKDQLDQYFSAADMQFSLNSGIDQFAAASGIDTSLIFVQYEMYNPGAQAPSYSYLYSREQ